MIPSLAFASSIQPSSVQDYVSLLKPRVMSLVVFTGIVGMLLAPGSIHPVIAISAILALAVGAGGAGALNMWYEYRIDSLMERTAKRPIPQGRITPSNALAFGMILSVGSVIMMGLVVNLLAALFLAFTIVFYVCVYTMWLKPTTSQNIVIGGVAGALPPLIGWVCVSPFFAWEPIFFVLIIFFWTVPHFWALSLLRVEDYRRAKIPMLPVVVGSKKTRQQIFIYSFLVVISSMLPVIWGSLGLIYAIVAGSLGLLIIYYAMLLLLHERYAFVLFKFSLIYLFFLYLAMLIDHYVG